MGLRNVINGMINGPRGQRQVNAGSSGKGMSRIFLALLGLFAYKAFTGQSNQQPSNLEPKKPTSPPRRWL
jgi:hypothetical protein